MPVSLATSADRVVQVARKELGVTERPSGSNRTKYGAAFGLDGNPWCAMFVWWVFREAGAGDLKKLLDPGIAYTPTFAAACARAGWKKVSAGQAQAGDIVFFDFPDSVFRIQHIGIAERRQSGDVVCLEGNTSVTSNDNGGAVMRRTRSPGHIKAIYRPIYAGDGGLTLDQVEAIKRHVDWRFKQLTEKVDHADAHHHQIDEALGALDRRVRELLSRIPSTMQVELRKNQRRAAVAAGYPIDKVDGAHTIEEDDVDPATLPAAQILAKLSEFDGVLNLVERRFRDDDDRDDRRCDDDGGEADEAVDTKPGWTIPGG